MDFENTIKGTNAEEYKDAYLDIVHYMANGCYNGENSLPVKTLETSMVALFNANKYAWHDLRKDPNDLPKDKTTVLTLHKMFGTNCFTVCQYENARFEDGINPYELLCKSLFAWREIEPFEER